MLKIIKDLLLKKIDDIDAGNSNIDEDQAIKVIRMLGDNSEDMSKYTAFKYLRISRAKFDSLIVEGKIPKGEHKQGYKELRWYKSDLDAYIKNNKLKKK